MTAANGVQVRPATAEDHDGVVALLRNLLEDRSEVLDRAKDTFLELLSGERGTVLVAVEEGRVVGVITFSYNLAIRYAGEYAQVEELIVDESQRGKGTGAVLVRAAIEAARKRPCPEIGLYAMEHTRAFYEKLGFEYVGPEVRMKLLDGG